MSHTIMEELSDKTKSSELCFLEIPKTAILPIVQMLPRKQGDPCIRCPRYCLEPRLYGSRSVSFFDS